jgi:hypothetical protein
MKPRHLIIPILISLLQSPAWAQQEGLGRLFFTPEQRAALDRQRLLNPGLSNDTMDSEGSQTLNGEVRRSSGRNTRWINGEPSWNNTPAPRVPVGDTYYPGTGERESVLGNGKIVVKPAPRTP